MDIPTYGGGVYFEMMALDFELEQVDGTKRIAIALLRPSGPIRSMVHAKPKRLMPHATWAMKVDFNDWMPIIIKMMIRGVGGAQPPTRIGREAGALATAPGKPSVSLERQLIKEGLVVGDYELRAVWTGGFWKQTVMQFPERILSNSIRMELRI